jgi:cation:H+ antiporter
VTWLAGTQLSNTTDLISSRFGLGEALGGIIILAIATNLSNIVVVVSASLTHHVGIAIGNILGGVAIQTVVLVILDGFGLRRKGALTYEAASLQLVLEGVLVMSVLVITIMGTQLPQSIIIARLAPGDVLIAVYIYGLIFRPKRQFLDLGIDSIVVLVLYIVGIVGLFTIGGGKYR